MIRKQFGLLLIVAFIAALAIGCGEDPVDANGDNDGDDPDDELTADDCEDDERWNPVKKECVSDPDANDENDEIGPDDCADDEVFDFDEEECVEDVSVNDPQGPDDCADDEIYEDGECIPDPEQCGPGAIEGQTCRPDDGILPGADVTVQGTDCDGDQFQESVTADSSGIYDFDDIPSGSHDIIITSGSFELEEDVVVQKGETTDLKSDAGKLCLDGDEVDIGIITGGWDDIAGILDPMGIDSEVIDDPSAVIADLDAMKDYDIIFVECTASITSLSGDQDDLRANVKRYIQEGNSMYASDFSHTYFQYGIPEAFTFYKEDEGDSGPKAGPQGVYDDIQVTSPEMQTLLGTDTVEIDLVTGANWGVIEDVSASGTVHFRFNGDIDDGGLVDAPLMATYDDPIGGGRAIYTSFHNEDQSGGSGMTDDMSDILEYMIFQL